MKIMVRPALAVLLLVAGASHDALAQSRSRADATADLAMRRRIDSIFAKMPVGDSADWHRADSLLHADPGQALEQCVCAQRQVGTDCG